MTETDQTTSGIHRPITFDGGAPREEQIKALALLSPTNGLVHQQFSNGEAVVYFRHLDVLRRQAAVPYGFSRSRGRGIKAQQIFDLPEWISAEAIRAHMDAL